MEKKKLIKYDEFRKWLMTCPIPYEQEEILDFEDDSIFFYTSKNTDKFKDNKVDKEEREEDEGILVKTWEEE